MSDNPSNNQQQPQTPTAPSHKVVWERDTLERLAFATLAEQRASRRWRIFFDSLGWRFLPCWRGRDFTVLV
jgi:protease-4